MKKKLIRGIILNVLSIIILVLPIAVLCFAKKNEWFINETTSTKMSLGFIIALIFAICLLKGAFKSIDKRCTTLFSLGIMLILVWLFDSFINDLFWIILMSIIGYLGYIVVNSFGKHELKVAKVYAEEKIRQEARKPDSEDLGW